MWHKWARCACVLVGSGFTVLVCASGVAAGRAPIASPARQPPSTGGTAIRSVWDGVYTVEQAKRGETAYAADCAPCHQADLYGDEYAPPLIKRGFHNRWDGESLGSFYQAIAKTMPQDQPGSLPAQEYVDVISFVLKANEMPAGPAALPVDQTQLDAIRIQQSPEK